jgi:hypothetical protein|tara:strand:+ start:10928 stop:11863 length:936 start_codon:yes stop_codon:yes gene_type:complete
MATASEYRAANSVSGDELSAEEARFLTLLNQHRVANGVAELIHSGDISAFANRRVVDGTANGVDTAHAFSDGRNVSDFGVGENQSRLVSRAGYSSDRTADSAFEEWSNSASHNAQMLNANYQYVGIALGKAGEKTDILLFSSGSPTPTGFKWDPNAVVIPDDAGPDAVFRFFNTENGSHFYTKSVAERDHVISTLDNFNYEGIAFSAAGSGALPTDEVHRFFNTQTGTHFFTQSDAEKESIETNLPHYSYDGVAYDAYAEPVDGSTPLYRFFNTQTGTHFFTASESEKDAVIDTLPHFAFEGTAYWVDPFL